jgi:D-cysteine desulfhydrase
VQACGSGATTGGLALANHLSGYGAQVIGYGVCDDEEYFYRFIDGLYQGLGANVAAKDVLRMVQCKGAGYAMSRCGSDQWTCARKGAVIAKAVGEYCAGTRSYKQ